MVYEMTPEAAALAIDQKLRKFAWYKTVGVGQTPSGLSIFIYVGSERHKELNELQRDGAHGYPVVVRRSGPIRALAAGY